MKKIILMASLVLALGTIEANAQQGPDAAQREARMKQTKMELMEKAKITEAQADQVMEIQRSIRDRMVAHQDLSDAERMKKLEEIIAENTAKYKEIPLTDDQVKAVVAFWDERRKQKK